MNANPLYLDDPEQTPTNGNGNISTHLPVPAGLTEVSNVNSEPMLKWDTAQAQLMFNLGECTQYFQSLQKNINTLPGAPLNTLGLPSKIPGFYCSPNVMLTALHHLPHDFAKASKHGTIFDAVPEEVINDSLHAIDTNYGYAIASYTGLPLWERLDGEPVPYYHLFKLYRDLVLTRATRSVMQLHDLGLGMPATHIASLSRAYHWQLRARCFDAYTKVEFAARKQKEVETLEGRHSKVSSDLLDQAVTYLLKHPEQMYAKHAITLTKLAVEIGRISVGLPMNGPREAGSNASKSNSNGPSVTVNNTNMQAGENAKQMALIHGSESVDADGNVVDNRSEIEKAAAETLGTTANMQAILNVLQQSGALDKANIDANLTRNSNRDEFKSESSEFFDQSKQKTIDISEESE